MRLDLEEMEQFPTNKIEGFRTNRETMFPSLIEHRCSEGMSWRIFFQSRTWYLDGTCVEHIANQSRWNGSRDLVELENKTLG
jgi:cyanophycin synthetase